MGAGSLSPDQAQALLRELRRRPQRPDLLVWLALLAAGIALGALAWEILR